MRGKREPTNGDADFFIAFALYGIEDLIARVMRKYDEPSETERQQLVMKGFEYLQCYYSVVRDGAKLYLPLKRLTDEEIEAKAVEHEAQASGHVKHAQELRDWAKTRSKGRKPKAE